MIEQTGLDTAATDALVALLDFTPSGPVQMLSRTIGLTHSGTVRLVDRLAAEGLVTRTAGADARSRSVVLTASGRRLARRARGARERAVTQLLDGLSDRERAALERAAGRLVSAITEQRLAQRARGELPRGGALCRICDFGACGRPDGDCPAAGTAAATRSAG